MEVDNKWADVHKLIAHALRLAEAMRAGEPCAGPECAYAVAYSGRGRPARYCSKRCRDRAAYRAAKQRKRMAGTPDDELTI